MEREISKHLLRLRRVHPFFATISLFARYQFDSCVDKFSTDGRAVKLNTTYLQSLSTDEKSGLILHVTLHAALQHTSRRGVRNPVIWNIAADIVVNNLILESGIFAPPRDTALQTDYDGLSVEQVYESLAGLNKTSSVIRDAVQDECRGQPSCQKSKNDGGGGAEHSDIKPSDRKIISVDEGLANVISRLYPAHQDIDDTHKERSAKSAGKQAVSNRRYWCAAFRQADAARRFGGRLQVTMPAGMTRELDALLSPAVDWRTKLWQYVVRTPTDFFGFDRRFMHAGLFLDALEAQELRVLVAIDTSGSIDDQELSRFVGELAAISRAYASINVTLYYVDSAIYGPYSVTSFSLPNDATGGGGTDFSVFFQSVVGEKAENEFEVIVYFTDGYGVFPDQPPHCDVLWVVPIGGLRSSDFPFGKVIRIACG